MCYLEATYAISIKNVICLYFCIKIVLILLKWASWDSVPYLSTDLLRFMYVFYSKLSQLPL